MALFPNVILYTLAYAVAVVVVLAVIMWAWGNFLDRHEHNPSRVRAAMCQILLLTLAVEAGLAHQNVVHRWVWRLSLLSAFWGSFDAILRFPAAHEIESFFSGKQIFLCFGKFLTYCCGMVNLRQHYPILLATIILIVWGLPMLYLMALPLDPREQVLRDTSKDVDIAVRLWRLLCSSTERAQWVSRWRGVWYQSLNTASDQSPLARMAICTASSHHRRLLRKRGRCV